MPPRLFIDCTETYNINLISGIQRVVREIVKRKDLISQEMGIQAIPVVFHEGRYIELGEFLKIKSKYNIKEIAKEGLKSRIKNERIYQLIKFFYLKAKNLKSYFTYISRDLFRESDEFFMPSDILFVPDIFWNPEYQSPCYKKTISEIKRKNVLVIFLVHDIIAFENPEYFMKYFIDQIYSSFFHMLSYTDYILTISKSEKVHIENYLRSNNIKKEVDYFYLGSDFTDKKITEDMLKETKIYAPYFLMVGTIEPRKGYDTAFCAFEKLWDAGFDKNLVIAGKVGWMVDELLLAIRNSKYFNKRLFLLNSVSDDLLQCLYKDAEAVICASKREGFGLPLVEAMHYKKPIIASDIDVFREIGKDYPIYFKPGNSDDLMNAVLKFQAGVRLNNTEFNPLTWDESVKMMCRRIKGLIKDAG